MKKSNLIKYVEITNLNFNAQNLNSCQTTMKQHLILVRNHYQIYFLETIQQNCYHLFLQQRYLNSKHELNVQLTLHDKYNTTKYLTLFVGLLEVKLLLTIFIFLVTEWQRYRFSIIFQFKSFCDGIKKKI